MQNINDLKNQILSLLSEKHGREYNTSQITSLLGMKKSHVIKVQAILNELLALGEILKHKKKYSISTNRIVKKISLLNHETECNIECTTEYFSDNNINDTIQKNKNIVTGKFDATSLIKSFSHAYVITNEGKDILVSAEDTLNAYHGDVVEVKIIRYKNEKRYGIITKVINRNKIRFVGIIETVRKNTYFRSDNFKIHTLFEVTDKMNASSSNKVIVEIINWGLRSKGKIPVCKVVEILGEAGNQEIEILSIIKEFGISFEFPEDVIKEANNLSDKILKKDIKKRIDLRKMFTFTIDPISARDYDDAISMVEEEDSSFSLYVHIADVTHYIKPNNALFDEAANRGNSYYFPNKVIPMLPEILSNKLCSLRPNEDKLTITVYTNFDKKGKIKKQSIYESIICSDFRLTYEEVDEYFDNNQPNFSQELCRTLDSMKNLSIKLSKIRHDKGYLSFDLPERMFIYDNDGYVTDIKQSKETLSHIIIENFMLIANEYVANLLKNKTKNTIFRIHEEPDDHDLIKIKDTLRIHRLSFKQDSNLNKTWQNILECLPNDKYHKVFDRLVLRSMKKAKYSTNNLRHFGLGIDSYTHFTSPIRRLCDLVVHYQLKTLVLRSFKDSIASPMIPIYAKTATDREVIADEAEGLMEKKLINTFIKQYLGKPFKAIINGMNSSSIFIELERFPIRGVIKLNQINDNYYEFKEQQYIIKGKRKGKTFKLCDEIDVVLINISDDLYFLPTDVYNMKDNFKRRRR